MDPSEAPVLTASTEQHTDHSSLRQQLQRGTHGQGAAGTLGTSKPIGCSGSTTSTSKAYQVHRGTHEDAVADFHLVGHVKELPQLLTDACLHRRGGGEGIEHNMGQVEKAEELLLLMLRERVAQSRRRLATLQLNMKR